tara:strand:- start:5123 stop:6046 length:924 start_codon:yes stop_codon:yes gene_type:complete
MKEKEEFPVNKVKVSVCVVTYNQEIYIRKCLQGIVDQETDFEFEVIVSDDCSTDCTRAIAQEFVESYPGIVRLVKRTNNMGGLKNFLETHKLAVGLYVSHLDGDDVMLPGKLQKQVNFLDANPTFSVVWHRMNFFDDIGGFMSGHEYDYSMFPDGIITIDHCVRLGSTCANSSTMYRRSARKTYEADGPLLDTFFNWEYLMSGKGMVLDEVLGEYNVSAQGSIRSSVDTKNLIAEHGFYYLNLVPELRGSIFIFALINLLSDLKNFRSSGWVFARLALAAVSFISPLLLGKTIFEAHKLRVPSLRYD